MVPGRDQQQRGGVGTGAVQRQQARGPGGHQRDDQLIEVGDLRVGEPGAAAQLPQRDAGGVAGHVPGPGPQRRQFADQLGGGVPGEPGPQLIRPVTISVRAWLMAWVRSARALRLATISARIATRRAVPALGRAGRPAGLRGPRRADRIQRIRLALAVTVPPVRPPGKVRGRRVIVRPGQRLVPCPFGRSS